MSEARCVACSAKVRLRLDGKVRSHQEGRTHCAGSQRPPLDVIAGEIASRPDQLMNVGLILRIAILEALAKGTSPDNLEEALLPTFREIRRIAAVAQDRLDEARTELARQREAHEQAIEHERELHHRTRVRSAERMADRIAGIQTANIDSDFDPRGYFVYFLWGSDDQRPLYVGKSTNVLARLGSHLGDWRKRDQVERVTLLKCASVQQMDSAETRMIHHYQPPLNTVGIISRDIYASP